VRDPSSAGRLADGGSLPVGNNAYPFTTDTPRHGPRLVSVVITVIAVAIPVVLADEHALHPTQHVDDGVPVIPSVLEDVGAMNLTVHPTRVSDEMIDLVRNVPGGFAIPVHPFVKVRGLLCEMRNRIQETSLAASSMVSALYRLLRRVLGLLVEDMRELAHSVVTPSVENPMSLVSASNSRDE